MLKQSLTQVKFGRKSQIWTNFGQELSVRPRRGPVLSRCGPRPRLLHSMTLALPATPHGHALVSLGKALGCAQILCTYG